MDVLVSLAQLVGTIHNICKVRGSNLSPHKGVYWIMILRDFKRFFYYEKVLWYSIKIFFQFKKSFVLFNQDSLSLKKSFVVFNQDS